MLALRNLAMLFTCSLVALVGCAASTDPTEEVGEGAGDALTAERQLNGAGLPTKTLSLTFDDGPGLRTTELAEFLEQNGVKGTFFINGAKVPGRQRAVESIVSHGHLLANHTQNHRSLTSLAGSAIVKEIADTDAIIAVAQPGGPWVLRAPFGAWNPGVAQALNGTPMRKYVGSVFWDEGGVLTTTAAADWDCWGKKVSVEHCGELYLNEIRSKGRGIVLMHDIHDRTVDMVKMIVPILLAEGFKLVPLETVPSVKTAIEAAKAESP